MLHPYPISQIWYIMNNMGFFMMVKTLNFGSEKVLFQKSQTLLQKGSLTHLNKYHMQ